MHEICNNMHEICNLYAMNMQIICNNKDQTICTPFYIMNEVIEIITKVMTYCFSQISTEEIIIGIDNFIIEDVDISKLSKMNSIILRHL